MHASADRTNTVERIRLDHFPPGPVFIDVVGHAISATANPQPYALAVHGRFKGYLGSPYNPDPDSPNHYSCGATAALLDYCTHRVYGDSTQFEFLVRGDIIGKEAKSALVQC